MQHSVTTYHLEMTDATQLRPSPTRDAAFRVQQAEIPCPELNRFFYMAVGGDWYWMTRRTWTHQQWSSYLERPEIETWIGYLSGTPVGYFELERQPADTVEIVYFGLLGQFIGRGLGGQLLTAAVERAWQLGTARVWVHTCTLDGPTALQNYQARGFRVFKEETDEEDLPDNPPGVWSDAAGA